MARRNRNRFISSPSSDERASLGDIHVDKAIGDLNQLQQRAVTLMTRYNVSRESTLPMLFRDDDLEKMKQVRGMVRAQSSIQAYQVQPDVKLGINFKDALLPTIEPERLYIQPHRFDQLVTFIAEVRAVHLQYEEVKAVLRMLNRHATPGAIRFYWPTAMKLVKDSPIWKDLQEVPSRFSQPPNLSDWLQSFKDSANTMAAAAMMPEGIQRRTNTMMWLEFAACPVGVRSSYIVDHANVPLYHTDSITYFI